MKINKDKSTTGSVSKKLLNSLLPGVMPGEVAEELDICLELLYRWRLE